MHATQISSATSTTATGATMLSSIGRRRVSAPHQVVLHHDRRKIQLGGKECIRSWVNGRLTMTGAADPAARKAARQMPRSPANLPAVATKKNAPNDSAAPAA